MAFLKSHCSETTHKTTIIPFIEEYKNIYIREQNKKNTIKRTGSSSYMKSFHYYLNISFVTASIFLKINRKLVKYK